MTINKMKSHTTKEGIVVDEVGNWTRELTQEERDEIEDFVNRDNPEDIYK